MKPCHNNRRIEKSEQSRKQPSEAGHQSTIDNIRNGVSYGPTDRSYNGMCDDNCRNKGTKRYDNHTDHFRAVFLKEFLQVYKDKSCHHGSNNLPLITDHLYLGKSKIPYRNIGRRCVRHTEPI